MAKETVVSKIPDAKQSVLRGKTPRKLTGKALEVQRQLINLSPDLVSELVSFPSKADKVDIGKFEIDKELTFGDTLGDIRQFQVRAFTTKRLADELAALLNADGVNYAFQINDGGKVAETRSRGFARSNADGGRNWNTDTRMHIASASKFFSAVALVKLLYKHGISFDRKISEFLPSYWPLGQKGQRMTFDSIMSHRSGLWSGDCEFAKVKREVEIAGYGIGEGWHYSNANYALMRILIPIINGNMNRTTDYGHLLSFGGLRISNDVAWDMLTQQYFDEYMQANIWRPSNVAFASLKSTKAFWNVPVLSGIDAYTNAAIGYGYPPVSTTTHGVDISSDLRGAAGAVGWHVSCDEMLRVANKVRRGGGIISTRTLNQMARLGFGFFGRHRNSHGIINYHDGIWAGSGVAEWSYLGFLGNRYEIAVLSNNERNVDDGRPRLGLLRDRVHTAYDAAI